MCPGKKDFKKLNGILYQKRMLLYNIKELHLMFLEYYKTKHNIDDKPLSLSKIFELKPIYCISVNSTGMHRVCVCVEHQNIKLMLNALPIKIDYKELISKISCDLENRNCMLRNCTECPNLDNLNDYITKIFTDYEYSGSDLVKYREWLHTDRSELIIQHVEVEDYIEKLLCRLENIKSHYFITKTQSSHLKKEKEKLDNKTAIILLDYSENYNFIYQDAIQSVHWDNTQATLHPVVIYVNNNNNLTVHSTCIISNHLLHNTSAVHSFLKIILDYIKIKFIEIENVIYFSDGAASQYKNFKNIANLCNHFNDFNIHAEWHFFATSHGKSPCDGVGGTIKRLVDRVVKQDKLDYVINTPKLMFEYCTKNIDNIKFFYLEIGDILDHISFYNLEDRYKKCAKFKGIRSHHSFKPIDEFSFRMKRVSSDVIYSDIQLVEIDNSEDIDVAYLIPGVYIECTYDSINYIGTITEQSLENCDIKIKFMKKVKDNIYTWPEKEDYCWIPFQDVIQILNTPNIISSRQYKFDITI